jgi:hypothetical protein
MTALIAVLLPGLERAHQDAPKERRVVVWENL